VQYVQLTGKTITKIWKKVVITALIILFFLYLYGIIKSVFSNKTAGGYFGQAE
jgi:hypothetical protein